MGLPSCLTVSRSGQHKLYKRDHTLSFMDDIKEQVEGLKLTNLSIDELLNPDFSGKIKALGLNAISLVLISDKTDANANEPVFPIVMNHQNKEEIKGKILHLHSPDSSLLERLLDSLRAVPHG